MNARSDPGIEVTGREEPPCSTHQFILRADPPPGQSIIETDRTTEWHVLNAVAAEGGIALPRACWFDEAGEELGSPAIILELIEGETLLSHLQVDEVADHRGFTSPLADMAASLHSFDADSLPAVIARPKSWDTYIDGCVAEWREAEAEHVEADPFMRLVAAWLDVNRPPETSLTMVHGDFQPPNIIVESLGGALHMIDWELTRIGDPREDLGWWALCSAAQPPDLIEADSEAFYARYRERTGLSPKVVNPATVAYFTVLSSASVFINVIKQTASRRPVPSASHT